VPGSVGIAGGGHSRGLPLNGKYHPLGAGVGRISLFWGLVRMVRPRNLVVALRLAGVTLFGLLRRALVLVRVRLFINRDGHNLEVPGPDVM
jgi:hypothetical protein